LEATPSATPAGTPSETSDPTYPPGIGFEPAGNWRVAAATVDGLRVRTAPTLDASPVLLPVADAKVPFVLSAGERVLRYQDAGSHDGYRWWEIFASPPDFGDLTLHGYVAAGPGDDPWLKDVKDPGCPVRPSIDELAALVPFMRIACYFQFPLTFRARYWTVPGEGYGGACGVGMEGVQVDWLQCENINYHWVNATGNSLQMLLLHYDPDVLAAPRLLAIQGDAFTITGHFMDPASDRCADGSSSADEQTVEWFECATNFVVERLKPAS
jgi:hypothetical protein